MDPKPLSTENITEILRIHDPIPRSFALLLEHVSSPLGFLKIDFSKTPGLGFDDPMYRRLALSQLKARITFNR
jgi:hypothetical protein